MGGFTKGPWFVDPDDSYLVYALREGVPTHVADSDPPALRTIESDEECIANARLIAAAPRLYAALDAICSEFAQGHPLIVEGSAALRQATSESNALGEGE